MANAKSTNEVLALFEGMKRDLLYYLEAIHFIEPRKEKEEVPSVVEG